MAPIAPCALHRVTHVDDLIVAQILGLMKQLSVVDLREVASRAEMRLQHRPFDEGPPMEERETMVQRSLRDGAELLLEFKDKADAIG
jgi:hypothetical protein